ncbi:hypothetical protein P7C70_g8512, partial [Phenoliferia sp. Uapishka_3]
MSRITISGITEQTEQPICGVCQVQFSRYTCPTCNLRYCSLSCFRSTLHSECSESFDRASLVDEIKSAKDKTGEEKKAMMDMLVRFEEQNKEAEERGSEDGEEEEEEDGEREKLERRLEGVDLDSLSPEDVLALLSPAQRAMFQETLQDPAKVSALVSAEFMDEPPWWIPTSKSTPAGDEDDEEESDEEEEDLKPPMLREDQLAVLKSDPEGKVVGHQLIYNITAVLCDPPHLKDIKRKALTCYETSASPTPTHSEHFPSLPSHLSVLTLRKEQHVST